MLASIVSQSSEGSAGGETEGDWTKPTGCHVVALQNPKSIRGGHEAHEMAPFEKLASTQMVRVDWEMTPRTLFRLQPSGGFLKMLSIDTSEKA